MGNFKGTIITGITALVIGIAIGWGLFATGTKKTDIKWKFGENELNINLDQDLVDSKAFLAKLFSEDFSKTGATDWLNKNQGLYSPHDPEIVPKISNLDYDEIVAKELRELSYRRVGPWDYQVDTVLVSIPEEKDQPKIGYANVCENGKYFTKEIRIRSLDLTQSIQVKATGRYACPRNWSYSDIQLNANDAEQLLGTAKFDKFQKAMALILTPE